MRPSAGSSASPKGAPALAGGQDEANPKVWGLQAALFWETRSGLGFLALWVTHARLGGRIHAHEGPKNLVPKHPNLGPASTSLHGGPVPLHRGGPGSVPLPHAGRGRHGEGRRCSAAPRARGGRGGRGGRQDVCSALSRSLSAAKLAQEPGINGERQFGCWWGGSQLVLPSSEKARAAEADESRRRRGPPTRAPGAEGEGSRLSSSSISGKRPRHKALLSHSPSPAHTNPAGAKERLAGAPGRKEPKQSGAPTPGPAALAHFAPERSGGSAPPPGAPAEAGGHRPHRPHRPHHHHHHLPAGHRSPRPRPGQGAGTRRGRGGERGTSGVWGAGGHPRHGTRTHRGLPGEGVGVPVGAGARRGELGGSRAPGRSRQGQAPSRRSAAPQPRGRGAARLLPTAKMEGRARAARLCPHGWIPRPQTSPRIPFSHPWGPPFPLRGPHHRPRPRRIPAGLRHPPR